MKVQELINFGSANSFSFSVNDILLECFPKFSDNKDFVQNKNMQFIFINNSLSFKNFSLVYCLWKYNILILTISLSSDKIRLDDMRNSVSILPS